MKRGAPEHPKVRRLARCLEIPRAHAVGLLELLYHFTARHAPQGNVGKWTDEEIAEGAGSEVPADAGGFIEAFCGCGLLDRDPEHRLIVHDWHDHADDSTRRTLANRGLEFFRSAGRNVPETSVPPEGKVPPVTGSGSGSAGQGSGRSETDLEKDARAWVNVLAREKGSKGAKIEFLWTELRRIEDEARAAFPKGRPDPEALRAKIRSMIVGWWRQRIRNPNGPGGAPGPATPKPRSTYVPPTKAELDAAARNRGKIEKWAAEMGSGRKRDAGGKHEAPAGDGDAEEESPTPAKPPDHNRD